MPAVESIRVEGLRDFQRELRQMHKEWPRELRKAAKKAADLVAEKTRSSFASRDGVAPKVAPSVKALAQQRSASVRIGGEKYPYAMGAEFGSIEYKQFEPWRGAGTDAGYSLFPTIRETRDEVSETFGDAIDDVARRAFPGRLG